MDRHAASRLKKEQVIWLVTAGKDGRPQAVPVWFVWDGKQFLIHAQDGIKVRHIRSNPNVELHLNSDAVGDDLVRMSGHAVIANSRPGRPSLVYMRKYARAIKDLDMTPASFSETYHNVIRVSRLKFR